MKTYSGRLWLVPHPESKLRVEIVFDDEKMKITSDDNIIGDWPLPDVTVRSTSRTEARLYVEGEELVVFSRDPDFMPALAAHKSKADRDMVSEPAQDSIDANVVSFDRDVARSRPISAVLDSYGGQVAASGGSRGSADTSDPDRGVHRAESRMLWKW